MCFHLSGGSGSGRRTHSTKTRLIERERERERKGAKTRREKTIWKMQLRSISPQTRTRRLLTPDAVDLPGTCISLSLSLTLAFLVPCSCLFYYSMEDGLQGGTGSHGGQVDDECLSDWIVGVKIDPHSSGARYSSYSSSFICRAVGRR